jgi:hypothetical protein
MGFNIAGGVTGSLAEVDTASLALRVTERPTDPVSLGAYLLAMSNGTTVMAAGLAAASPVYAFRWGNANLCVLNSVQISLSTIVAFAATRIQFGAFRVGGGTFTNSYTGGTAATLTGGNCKKRTSFGTTLLTDCRISATATLTSGTGETLDAQPFGEVIAIDITASAHTHFINAPLYVRDTGDEYPLVFAQNEGFVIRATVPATGTWHFNVTTDWLEIASY